MYINYVNEIINIIFRDNNEECDTLMVRGKEIGKEIYKTSGYKGLYILMDVLVEELTQNEYSSEYLTSLRELECSFNGICDEWQM